MTAGNERCSARLERLAQQVRDELRDAGVPVIPAGALAGDEHAGAAVFIDYSPQTLGWGEPELVVRWETSRRLVAAAVDALSHRRVDDPAIRRHGRTEEAMAAAVIAILSAGGFAAEDWDNDMSPFGVRVLSGPDQDTSSETRSGQD